MSEVLIQESTLSAIGDAIRSKTGSTNLMSPAEMVTAIDGIETGGGETINLMSLKRSSTMKSYGNTSSAVYGGSAFSFTINPNFVCGFLIMAVRMQSTNSTLITNNTTMYRTVYLITINDIQDITSKDDVFSYYKLAGYRYDDDPIIVGTHVNQTADMEKVYNGDFDGITVTFDVGRSADGVGGGAKYSYKFSAAANDNIRFFQFYKS